MLGPWRARAACACRCWPWCAPLPGARASWYYWRGRDAGLQATEDDVVDPVMAFAQANVKNGDWHFRDAALMVIGAWQCRPPPALPSDFSWVLPAACCLSLRMIGQAL